MLCALAWSEKCKCVHVAVCPYIKMTKPFPILHRFLLQAENIYNDEDPEGAADTEVQG